MAKAKVRGKAKAVKAVKRVAKVSVATRVKATAKRVQARAKSVAKKVKTVTTKAKAVAVRVRRVVNAVSRPKWVEKGCEYVNAYLCVRDVKATAEFYEKAFGFTKKMIVPGPTGDPFHAEMLWQGQIVMFGKADPSKGFLSPRDIGGSPVTIYVYCKNVDAMVERARAAGGQVTYEPADQFYGDRTAAITDPEGHRWMFATHVRDHVEMPVPSSKDHGRETPQATA